MKPSLFSFLRLRFFLFTALLRFAGWLLARLLRRAAATTPRSAGARPAARVIDGEFRRVDTSSRLH